MENKQLSFSDMEYAERKRISKREKFLKQMNEIIPWAAWCNFTRKTSKMKKAV